MTNMLDVYSRVHVFSRHDLNIIDGIRRMGVELSKFDGSRVTHQSETRGKDKVSRC